MANFMTWDGAFKTTQRNLSAVSFGGHNAVPAPAGSDTAYFTVTFPASSHDETDYVVLEVTVTSSGEVCGYLATESGVSTLTPEDASQVTCHLISGDQYSASNELLSQQSSALTFSSSEAPPSGIYCLTNSNDKKTRVFIPRGYGFVMASSDAYSVNFLATELHS